jgi:hypothetical protein
VHEGPASPFDAGPYRDRNSYSQVARVCPARQLATSSSIARGFDSTGNPAACHAFQPPARARARGQPAFLNSRAARALVASSAQAQ